MRYTKRELLLAILAGGLTVVVVVLLGFVLFRGPPQASQPGNAAVVTAHPTQVASPPRTTGPAQALRTEYSVRGRWANGFYAELVITNLGSQPVEGWTVRLRLPPDVRVSSAWSADVTQAAGAVILRSQPWNTYVAPGAAIHMGFEATGTPAPPSSCTINGSAC